MNSYAIGLLILTMCFLMIIFSFGECCKSCNQKQLIKLTEDDSVSVYMGFIETHEPDYVIFDIPDYGTMILQAGYIKYMAIYNRTLSKDEIKDIMKNKTNFIYNGSISEFTPCGIRDFIHKTAND